MDDDTQDDKSVVAESHGSGNEEDALLELLPENLREKVEAIPRENRLQVTALILNFIQSPHPTAQELRAIKDVIEDGPQRIFAMLEKDQDDTSELSRRILNNHRLSIIATALGTLAGFAVLGLATWKGNLYIALPLLVLGFLEPLRQALKRFRRKNGNDDNGQE